jgi:hypothetical protein
MISGSSSFSTQEKYSPGGENRIEQDPVDSSIGGWELDITTRVAEPHHLRSTYRLIELGCMHYRQLREGKGIRSLLVDHVSQDREDTRLAIRAPRV